MNTGTHLTPARLPRLPIIATCLVGGAAAILTAVATHDVVVAHGVVSNSTLGWLYPIVVEAGSVTAALLAWRRTLAGLGAGIERLGLLVLMALAVWTNCSHVAGAEALAMFLAAAPPFVVVSSVELLLRAQRETHPRDAHGVVGASERVKTDALGGADAPIGALLGADETHPVDAHGAPETHPDALERSVESTAVDTADQEQPLEGTETALGAIDAPPVGVGVPEQGAGRKTADAGDAAVGAQGASKERSGDAETCPVGLEERSTDSGDAPSRKTRPKERSTGRGDAPGSAEARCASLLAENPEMTGAELATALGVSAGYARKLRSKVTQPRLTVVG